VSREDTLADQLRIDYTQAALTDRERAMLDYAVKLTRTPWAMREDDLQPLRSSGFDDLAILHIVALVGFFNYVNRVADALGLRLEEGMWDLMQQHGAVPWEAESGSLRPAGV
jgi:uncharacterized peroxidase-related enzyme